MDSAVILVLLTLLMAFVNDATASCKEIANDDILEYFCEDSHPTDLNSLPFETEKLRINRMPLRRITTDTFSRFNKNLLVLGCLHCEIIEIDADAFQNLVNLQQLSLGSNYLTSVKASWFKNLNYLTYLDLSYNHIRDIEDDVYKNLPSLVDFRISGNQLRCLNLDEMSHLNELKRIFLSENADFACPHAVSRFLENRGVVFEQDPEWRKLVDDTIHVYVPPNYVEEDRRTTYPTYPIEPPYREKPQPNKPFSEETRVHDITSTKNGIFSSRSEHYNYNKRPTTTTMRPKNKISLPYVEQFPYPDPAISNVPMESSLHQEMHYPYSTMETSQVSPIEMESSLENIRMAETDKSSERTLPPYISMHQSHPVTHPYPIHPVTEDMQIIGSKSFTENEVAANSDRSLQMETIVTYPRYNIPVTIPYDQERMSYESNEITYPSFNDFDTSTSRISTDHLYQNMDKSTEVPSEHSDIPFWMQDKKRYDEESFRFSTDSSNHHEPSTDAPNKHSNTPFWIQDKKHYEEFLRFTTDSSNHYEPLSSTNIPDFQTTYRVQDQHKILDKGSNTDDLFITTERVETDASQTMISNNVYVRPSLPSFPEIMYSPSTDQFYHQYSKDKVTLHPPLPSSENIGEDTRKTIYFSPLTTTDKPYPDNSALRLRPDIILMMSIIITVFGHIIIGRF